VDIPVVENGGRVMGNPSALAGFLLLLGVTTASPTSAQTPGLVSGAYERLSPGNQKVARALFDAQAAVAQPSSGPSTGVSKTLSLDEIAAQKQNGTAWGQVFSAMKARGLLREKDLGQVVTRYQHQSSGTMAAAPKSKPVDR
jgi:hypothetical protein